jgi:tetratricopeptide (TPR) repeat protein
MPFWFTILLCVLGALTVLLLLWNGLKRAEATDRPAERLLIRIGLSLLLVVGAGAFLQLAFRSGGAVGGGMVGGFAVAFVIAGAAAVLGILLGLIWAPEFGNLMAKPFVSLFMGSDEIPKPEPLYSAAQVRRKQGRYAEAIAEIRVQLERFPDDPQGWLMLADIQMDDLRDFAQAEATIQEFIARPNQTPQQIILGRSRLADWHLKYHQDFEAAKAIFQGIVDQYPDLPQARMAYQRLAHIEEMREYAAEHSGRARAVPHADPHLGLFDRKTPETVPASSSPDEMERLIQHLEAFPLDREAREKVALVYAHEHHRPDLCGEQMEYLLGLPDARPSEIARWLNLLADVYVKEARDIEAARQSLERVVEMLPGTPAASQALRRMDLLETEVRNSQETAQVRLGTYEQNVGLKVKKRRRWWNEPE